MRCVDAHGRGRLARLFVDRLVFGIELDFRWLTPWEPLSVRGGGALTDARFRKFPNAPAIADSGMAEQDLSGKLMPFVPKTQLIVTPELRFPFHSPALPMVGELLPPQMAVTVALDVLYRSSMYLDSDLDPNTLQWDLMPTRRAPLGYIKPGSRQVPTYAAYTVCCKQPEYDLSILAFEHLEGARYFEPAGTLPPTFQLENSTW